MKVQSHKTLNSFATQLHQISLKNPLIQIQNLPNQIINQAKQSRSILITIRYFYCPGKKKRDPKYLAGKKARRSAEQLKIWEGEGDGNGEAGGSCFTCCGNGVRTMTQSIQ